MSKSYVLGELFHTMYFENGFTLTTETGDALYALSISVAKNNYRALEFDERHAKTAVITVDQYVKVMSTVAGFHYSTGTIEAEEILQKLLKK